MARGANKSGVLKLGRTSYAINVLWNDTTDTTKPAQEAKAFAALPSVAGDFYVVNPEASQIGVGHKASGHAKGMTCLAPLLVSGERGSWLGVFEIDDGFYVVGSRGEGRVTHDQFYATFQHAIEQVGELLGSSEFQRFIAPAAVADGVGVASYEDIQLAGFLKPGKGLKLVALSSSSPLTKILLLGFVVVGAGFGWFYYQQYLEQLRFEEEQAAFANDIPQKVEIPPAPWENRSKGAETLTACSSAMNSTLLTYAGWEISAVNCSSSGVVQSLTREPLASGGSPLTWIRKSLDLNGHQDVSISPSGSDSANVQWPVGSTGQWEKASGDTTKIRESKFLLQSSFEEKFTAIEFAPGNGTEFFATENFSFQTSYDPSYFSEIVSRISGLVIDTVSYNRETANFTVTGAFHEKLPPRLPQ